MASAESLLPGAIRSLEARDWIAAKLGVSVHILGEELAGWGMYAEHNSNQGRRYRLELKMQMADATSSLLEVCDGNFRWRYHELGQTASMTYLDLNRVARAIHAHPNGQIEKVDAWFEIGGLPRLLSRLHKAIAIEEVEPGRLSEVPVWRLQGRWSQATLLALLPAQKQAIENQQAVDLTQLPPHVPDRVVLFLGQDDLFPYRFEFHRTAPPKRGRWAGDAGQAGLLLALQLSEVNLNVPIDPSRFSYNPGDLDKFTDETSQYLSARGLLAE